MAARSRMASPLRPPPTSPPAPPAAGSQAEPPAPGAAVPRSQAVTTLPPLRPLTGYEEEFLEQHQHDANTARLCNEVLARCLVPPGADHTPAWPRCGPCWSPSVTARFSNCDGSRSGLRSAGRSTARTAPSPWRPNSPWTHWRSTFQRCHARSRPWWRAPAWPGCASRPLGTRRTCSRSPRAPSPPGAAGCSVVACLTSPAMRPAGRTEMTQRGSASPAPCRSRSAGSWNPRSRTRCRGWTSRWPWSARIARGGSSPRSTFSSFFFELSQRTGNFLREVHQLALAYHWSERDILGLPLRRRLAYLLLLEQDADAALLRDLTVGAGQSDPAAPDPARSGPATHRRAPRHGENACGGLAMTSLSAVVAGPLRSRPVSAPPGGPVGLVALTRAPLARGGSLSATTRIEGSVLRRGPPASTARDRPPAPASRPRRHRRPGGGGPRAASQVPLIPLITRTPSPVEHPGGADAGRWARSPRFLRTGRGAGHPGGPRMTPRPPRARSKGLASAPGTDEPRAAGQRPAHRARRPGTAAPSATRGTQPTGHPRLGAWRSAGHRSRSGRHQAGRQTTRPVARRVRTGPRPAPATTQRSICGPGAAGPAPAGGRRYRGWGRRAPIGLGTRPCAATAGRDRRHTGAGCHGVGRTPRRRHRH